MVRIKIKKLRIRVSYRDNKIKERKIFRYVSKWFVWGTVGVKAEICAEKRTL